MSREDPFGLDDRPRADPGPAAAGRRRAGRAPRVAAGMAVSPREHPNPLVAAFGSLLAFAPGARSRRPRRPTRRRCATRLLDGLVAARDAAVARGRAARHAPTGRHGRWPRCSTTSRSTRPGGARAPGRGSRSSRRSTATSTPARASSSGWRSSSATRPATATCSSCSRPASRSASAASTGCRDAPGRARWRRCGPPRPGCFATRRPRRRRCRRTGRASSPPTRRGGSRCRSGRCSPRRWWSAAGVYLLLSLRLDGQAEELAALARVAAAARARGDLPPGARPARRRGVRGARAGRLRAGARVPGGGARGPAARR